MKSSYHDLAGMLSDISGTSYENCLTRLKQNSAVDQFGTISASGLRSVGGELHLSNSSLASSLSQRTGISFENALTYLNHGD
jgi:hypothetical protein